MLDLSLFPTQEEWGTGDEAVDIKLSTALKFVTSNLSFENISDFYFFGQNLKLRIYNPSFKMNIELITKALLHLLDKNECVDHSLKKIKGHYYAKEKIEFNSDSFHLLISELETAKKSRFKNQIDFSITFQASSERNPFVREELKRSSMDLNAKIIFKEFRSYLNDEQEIDLNTEPFFQSLRGGKNILVIKQFAEIWFHQDQIFALIDSLRTR